MQDIKQQETQMASIAVQTYLTPEEYLVLERKTTLKSEYLSGEIVAMSGASHPHNLITMNIANGLYNQLADRGCQVFASDMRVGINAGDSYFYPDVSVVCDNPRFEDNEFDTLINPTVVVEVLSQSTETNDKGEKFTRYKQLESLQEYILISQDQIRVEHYFRQGSIWKSDELTSLEDILLLTSVDAELPMQQVYRFVKIDNSD